MLEYRSFSSTMHMNSSKSVPKTSLSLQLYSVAT